MKSTISQSEKEWQMKSDCRVLSDYADIVADKKRYQAALDYAQKMIDEKQSEIDNLKYLVKEGMED